MKKINSINYGHKVMGTALVFLIAFPVCFILSFTLFQAAILKIMAYVSLCIGILISVCFAGLLAVEWHQDRSVERQYNVLRKTRIELGSGRYECQSCGNRQVGAADRECKICGMFFCREQEDGNEDGE